MITLSETMIGNLTWKGVLAYVAVSLAGGGRYTTAILATAVQCPNAAMKEGMGELATHHPDVVQWIKGERKWRIGGDAKPIDELEVQDRRRLDLIDDIKKFWDHVNPHLPFSFGGPDGSAVNQFIKRNRDWTRAMWQQALNNRAKSEINRADPVYKWMSKLESYINTPLDRYMQPMTNGGGRIGKAIDVEDSNRAAREAALAGTANRV